MSKAKKNPQVRLGLALQGGGSYGAYTKGVLKTLFASEAFTTKKNLEITAITGTSAGAVNGAIATYGLNKGGYSEAIRILDSFWGEIEQNGRLMNLWGLAQTFNYFVQAVPYPNLPAEAKSAMKMLPAGSVPANLQDQVQRHMPDWENITRGKTKLFVNAVQENAQTGERSHIVFKGEDLKPSSIAASGALEELGGYIVDGQKLFDGAYWRNPCTTDLRGENITDLLVITLQRKPQNGVKPEHQDDARKKNGDEGRRVLTEEIHNHIAYFHKSYPHINLHVISLDVDPSWDETSRMNIDPRWLNDLEQMGKRDAEDWLKRHATHLGKKSSYDPAAP